MSTSNKSKQFSQIPCAICGSSSSGYHFGAISCESCKVFFCRSLKRPCLDEQGGAPYLHRCSGPNGSPPSNCQRCRFDNCIKAGMSLSSVCIGRHSAERRLQKTIALTKLAEKNQLLPGHISRRRNADHNNELFVNSKPDDVGKSEVTMPSDPEQETPTTTTLEQPSFTSSVRLVNECNIMPQDDIASNIEELIQQAVASVGHLNDIRTMSYIPISAPDMTTEAVSVTMMGGQRAYTEVIRRFVRSLPGFSQIDDISDRIRLFNGASHPLYSTQLSLDYDTVNQVPKFFSIAPGMSQRVVLDRFPELIGIFHQFADSGVAVTSAQFTHVELALLSALIFFNPNPYPRVEDDDFDLYDKSETIIGKNPCSRLNDAKKVQMISTKYWQAVERFIRGTFPPETAARRLAVFNELLNYLRNTADLMNRTMLQIVEQHPWMLKQSPLFEEVLKKLLADNVKPKQQQLKQKTTSCNSYNLDKRQSIVHPYYSSCDYQVVKNEPTVMSYDVLL